MVDLIGNGTIDMNFEKICRTCLSSDRSLVSIFGNTILDMSGSEAAVIDLLSTLMDIKISATDCLPDKICPICLEEIKRAYSFKLKSKNSEAKLNHYLQDYCKKMVEDADKNESSVAQVTPESSKVKQVNNNNNNSADKINSEGTKDKFSSVSANGEEDDDVVCVSDDESLPCENNTVQNCEMSNESTMEPEQIEISDDEDEDYDGYHEYNVGYSQDDDSFQDNSENKSNSQSPFVIQEYYSLQGMESDYINCPSCSQIFQSTLDLKKHIKDKHTVGLTCNICQRDFSSSSNLFEHCSIHVPVCYPCPICGYKLKQEKYLKKHMERHSREKEVKCDLCNEMFLTSSEMRVHALLVHIEEKNSMFKCNICGLKLPNAGLLNSHKEKHSMVARNHVCDICSKAFRSKTKLTEHYRLHTGEKPYVCQFCRKQFRLQFSLRMHMAIHTNEHFFKCRICYTTFRQRSELQKHIQIHRESMS